MASTWQRLKGSLVNSAGTIVFGMEDGTVSIFGLIFGVAATTSDTKTVLIAGASGAVAAAVSMMAGAYLDIETTRDEVRARRAALQSDTAVSAGAASLPARLVAAGLTQEQSAALTGAVIQNHPALSGLLLALQGAAEAPQNPWEQALWMLLADFLAAAVPILPFVFLPITQARVISGVVTFALLVLLGIGRARIANRSTARTVIETVSIGIAAALAGIAIGVLINRFFY
ncbi:MAG TPA: VIT1/CCC1 transporter family protein [Xanthobacteraceae bacterium]|nr:VIT1/CCC1 transporter family protein [Xanthobacteraceae bacterium]